VSREAFGVNRSAAFRGTRGALAFAAGSGNKAPQSGALQSFAGLRLQLEYLNIREFMGPEDSKMPRNG
jgi:hypothetical protein